MAGSTHAAKANDTENRKEFREKEQPTDEIESPALGVLDEGWDDLETADVEVASLVRPSRDDA